jgi:hypothetical protein
VTRTLLQYGLEVSDAAEYVIEDPALVDGLMVRMFEDIDLSIQTYAIMNGAPSISPGLVEAVFKGLNIAVIHEGEGISPGLLTWIRYGFQSYRRGPLSYESGSDEWVANSLAFVTQSFLLSGQRNAAADRVTTIRLRHLLSFCDELPYPLNKMLC